MKFHELNNEEVARLTHEELTKYMNEFTIYRQYLEHQEWKSKSWEEKKVSIFSDHEFCLNKRGIEEITLEESIEFALKNEPNEKSNYVTPLVKHYFSVRNNEKFTFFWETSSPFSQWHKSKFSATTCMILGVSMKKYMREDVLQNLFPSEVQEYSSAEQFMMYHKAIIFLDLESAKKIMSTHNVREIKELGRSVQNFNEEVWRFYRSSVVYEGNKAKFSQNEELKNELFATKGKTLVEAAPNDTIWGIGLAEDDPRATKRETWLGKNLLGEILTQIRIELMGEY